MGSPKNVVLFVVMGVLFSILALSVSGSGNATPHYKHYIEASKTISAIDTPETDTTKLKYPIEDTENFKDKKKNPLDLQDPDNIKKEVVYDSATGNYIEKQTVGGNDYRLPQTKTMEEYLEERRQKENQSYFRQRSKAQNFVKGNSIIPKLNLGPKV